MGFVATPIINRLFDRHNAKGIEKAIVKCYVHSCK